ncbi:MAG: flagellar motor switch protein FliN [Burkholderiales bacterium]|jgi:flagellar motor switch protein FliN/FliY|nr:flagellar motor switch protein FliN [Burkholderiales bacterium]
MADYASIDEGRVATAPSGWDQTLNDQQGIPSQREPQVSPHVFNELSSKPRQGIPSDIDMIMDIPVGVTVELGRAKISIRELLSIAPGSVVELDSLAGTPLNMLVNGCLIARGEVVVVDDRFGIRLIDITSPNERLKKLRS